MHDIVTKKFDFTEMEKGNFVAEIVDNHGMLDDFTELSSVPLVQSERD